MKKHFLTYHNNELAQNVLPEQKPVQANRPIYISLNILKEFILPVTNATIRHNLEASTCGVEGLVLFGHILHVNCN